MKSQIDAMQKSVSGTILLASVTEASTFDDIGTMLYSGIIEINSKNWTKIDAMQKSNWCNAKVC